MPNLSEEVDGSTFNFQFSSIFSILYNFSQKMIEINDENKNLTINLEKKSIQLYGDLQVLQNF